MLIYNSKVQNWGPQFELFSCKYTILQDRTGKLLSWLWTLSVRIVPLAISVLLALSVSIQKVYFLNIQISAFRYMKLSPNK